MARGNLFGPSPSANLVGIDVENLRKRTQGFPPLVPVPGVAHVCRSPHCSRCGYSCYHTGYPIHPFSATHRPQREPAVFTHPVQHMVWAVHSERIYRYPIIHPLAMGGYEMSDFFQNGEIATFHKLKHRELSELEAELEQSSKHRPISLVLPYIPIELKGAGLPRIAEELSKVRYLKNVIVPVGKASLEDFKDAKRFFSALPQKPRLVWCTGPRVQSIYELL